MPMSTRFIEFANFRRGMNQPDIELLYARYTKHSFTPHFHDVFAVGVVEAGALTNSYKHNLPDIFGAGDLFVINPGDVHTGKPVGDQGVTYRMMYLPTRIVSQWLQGRNVSDGTLHAFPRKGTNRNELPQQLIRLHQLLAGPEYSQLEQESILTEVLTQLFSSPMAVEEPKPGDSGKNREVNIVIDYLISNFSENISLIQLSAMTNVSPYHLLRIFQKQVGISPHTFQTLQRIEHAKRCILQNEFLTQISVQVGFYDQSHFIKTFKAIVGVTPSQFVGQIR